MAEKTYKLKYLDLFEQDLTETINYISTVLENPAAAQFLLNDTEKAIFTRLLMPLAFEPYRLKKESRHPYYIKRVRNYIVFYVVIDDVMEVRRFMYNKRDVKDLID